jgi:tetratricopeptide (TPR) repeat protein
MRYATTLLLIPLLLPPALAAQTNTNQADDTSRTIVRAYDLEEQGHIAEAVALTQPLADSGKLHGAELGRAWTVLGLAYTDQGTFTQAQHAFEQAIAILQPLPENVRDYAAALDNFGTLYRAMGQLDSSVGLRLKTLHIYEQIGDHSGIARACNNLASLALLQRDMKKGREYLKRSAEEMKVATALDDDDVAAIYSMQAEFAGISGNPQGAIVGYQRALQTWRRVHNEDHRNIGWGHMLLGQAYAEAGRVDEATQEMQHGLSILDHLFGRSNPYYLQAEIAYSRLLDETGAHDVAARLRTADQATLKAYYQRQCVGCTISVDALR